MEWLKDILEFQTSGKSLIAINAEIDALIRKHQVAEGMCFLFIPHASASLAISEGYDPSARVDVENFYERMVPENQSWYQHTLEGKDDSPSHIRSTLTQVSLAIPVDNSKLGLGVWQSVYLFEHRTRRQTRKVIVRFLKVS